MTLDAVFAAALVAATAFATLRSTPPVEAPTIQIAPESEAMSITVRQKQRELTRNAEIARRMCSCGCCCEWCEALEP